MPVQGGAHRPRLEEWHPFSAQVANDDDGCANKQPSSSRNLTYITRLHPCATAIVQAHSRQRRRSSSPKEYICYTKLTRGAWMVITISLAACLLEFDQNLTAMRHAPCGRQTIASLNRARWGDNVYIPVVGLGLCRLQQPAHPAPLLLNQTPTAMHPSPIVPTIQPMEFCGSL